MYAGLRLYIAQYAWIDGTVGIQTSLFGRLYVICLVSASVRLRIYNLIFISVFYRAEHVSSLCAWLKISGRNMHSEIKFQTFDEVTMLYLF